MKTVSSLPKVARVLLALQITLFSLLPTTPIAEAGPANRQVHPNPFTVDTTFQLSIPERSDQATIRIDVYNIRGQHVRNLYGPDKHPAGVYPVYWDGADDEGRPVVEGIYFCVLVAEGVTVKSVKVVKIAA